MLRLDQAWTKANGFAPLGLGTAGIFLLRVCITQLVVADGVAGIVFQS